MSNYNAAPPDEQIKNLLEQNLAYSKQIYLLTKKVKNYMLIGRIMGIIYIILIVGPLIAGVIFLPSLLKGFMGNIFPGAFNQEESQTAPAAGFNDLLKKDNLTKDDLIKAIQQNGGVVNSYKNILDLYNSQ